MTKWTPASSKIRLVMSTADADEAREFLLSCIVIAEDVETLPHLMLMNVVGFAGLRADGEIRTYVFPFYMSKSPTSGTPSGLGRYLEVIQEVNLSGIPLIFHNGPYDVIWLIRYGCTPVNYAYDTMVMFWSLFPEYPKDLAFVSSILLDDYQYWKGDRKSDSWETFLIYNGKDCDRTLRCFIRLAELISREPGVAANLMDAHIRTLIGIDMSARGAKVSETKKAEHSATLHKDAEARLERLRYIIADSEFNPNSPAQKLNLLYTLLGARLRNSRGRFVSKIQDASTGAIPMRAMRSEHPIIGIIVQSIMDTMEPAKQISNVIKMPLAKWSESEAPRFYTSYNGVGTTTTRYGSSGSPINVGSNAQNIRKDYRDILVADKDSFLLDIDFSAADDVFVSFESGDPHKIELFRSGRDTHSYNATLFFPNWTYDMVVNGKKARDTDHALYERVTHPITGIRQITKKLSHGCNYLMAALTLLMTAGREAIVAAAKELGHEDAGTWTQEKLAEFCGSLELKYRNHYTRFQREGAHSWYTDLWTEFCETGGFLTPFGYFQRFLSEKTDRNVLRAIAATAGQAGTAGRINMAMAELTFGIIKPNFRDAPNPDYGVKPCQISLAEHGIDKRFQTHDSLTFNVNYTHPNWQEGIRRIYEVMYRPVVIRNKLTNVLETFHVNLESEMGFGWGPGLIGCKNRVEGEGGVELTLQKLLATHTI